LTKKRKTSKATARPSRQSFDPESSPFFVPAAFVIIFVVLLVLFSGFVFSDNMLYMSDQIQAGIFFRSFLVDHVHEYGSVPQWNPYIFCGMPYVDAFHGDIFYPGSFLKYFLSPYRWQGWTFFFHIFLAGVLMYFAARQFRLSKTPALMSAVCYMFAAYLVSQVAPGHDGKVYVTTLFPLVMLLLERGLRSDRLRQAFFNFSLLGLIIGVVILSPHPQMSYFMLWAVAFYTVFRLIVNWRETKSVARLIRPSVLAAYAVIIGLLVSAIQFYPGYNYTTNFSPRSDQKQGWDWATSWSLHEEEAFSLLIPEFCGTSSRKAETYYWGKNAFKDNSEAVGVVAFFVALIGLFFSRRKEAYFFGGLALFALIYALGATTPIFKIFFYLIPKVKALRVPSIIMFIFSFSMALLAGMAVQALMRGREEKNGGFSKKFNYLLLGFPGLLLILALLFSLDGRSMLSLWSSLFYSEAPLIEVQRGLTRLDLAYMNLPAIQSGAWLAFLFCALAALFIWLYRSRKSGIWILVALAALPVIEGVRFNRRFIETVDANMVLGSDPVTDFFDQTPGNYRVMNLAQRVVPEDKLPLHGTEVVVGYHGNQLRWFDNLLGGVSKRNQANARFLNLVGAEYLLIPGGQAFPEEYFGPQPVTPVADFGSVRIWRNENAFPRSFLASQYKVAEGVEDARGWVLGRDLDLRQVVVLEEQPSLEYVSDTLASDSVWVVSHESDSVAIGVNCSGNRILVLTDNYYESWHTYVDGEEVPVLRCYGTFRAVELEAGMHDVCFKYSSNKYRTGKLATGLTLAYLLVILGLNVYMQRRQRDPERKT